MYSPVSNGIVPASAFSLQHLKISRPYLQPEQISGRHSDREENHHQDPNRDLFHSQMMSINGFHKTGFFHQNKYPTKALTRKKIAAIRITVMIHAVISSLFQ